MPQQRISNIMDGMGGVGISSIISTVHILQKVYELAHVGPQARDLLNTTMHVDRSMQHARALRRQKSLLLNKTDKQWIDDIIKDTEEAVGGVAALVEAARVDMQTSKSKTIGLTTKAIYVFRDSPNVAVNLSRLSIASQSLNAVIGVLYSREGSRQLQDGGPIVKVDSGGDRPAPPSYEDSVLLQWRKSSRRLQRQPEQVELRRDPSEEGNLPAKSTEADDFLVPTVDVMQVLPAPTTQSSSSNFESADGCLDGLQVDNDWELQAPTICGEVSRFTPRDPPRRLDANPESRAVGLQRSRSWLAHRAGR